jgi:hypothetical protein
VPGEVAYAAGHFDVTIEAWERTHAAGVQAGDEVAAAGAAVRLAMHLLFDTTLMAPVRGWLAPTSMGASGPLAGAGQQGRRAGRASRRRTRLHASRALARRRLERSRSTSSIGVRARRQAITRIADHLPQLGEHLSRTVRTGTYCAYAPAPRDPVAWE